MSSNKGAILIRNGTVVNEDQIFSADVLIRDGKIVKVFETMDVPQNEENLEIIDASDCYVIPGGIDPHTHMQLPFMGEVAADDFYTGTRAALAGGTTMIIDFVISTRALPPLAAYAQWRAWADPKVCCDYGLSMAITYWDEKETPKEMATVSNVEYGINSFKFFMAYKNLYMVDDYELFQDNIGLMHNCPRFLLTRFYSLPMESTDRQANGKQSLKWMGLKVCAKIGALARVHAENGSVIAAKQQELLAQGVTGPEGHPQSRPEELEAEATNRACVLASQAHCPLYVVHVMSYGAAEAIASHRQKGAVVFGEPIAASLALDGSHYYDKDWSHAAGFILSPPLSRKKDTPGMLMNLLACGQLQLTGTDNCTFTCAQKRAGREDFTKIPNGVNGVEDRMSIIWERGVKAGKIDPMRFVAVTSSTAAKIFNVYPRKGRIAEGSDADVVIWDGDQWREISARTHHHATDFNIFEGMRVRGVALATIAGGQVVWRDGAFTGALRAGAGRFIPLPADCPYVFGATRVAQQVQKAQRTDN